MVIPRCKPDEAEEYINIKVLREIHQKEPDASIIECTINEQIIYILSFNMADSNSDLYNYNGVYLGFCGNLYGGNSDLCAGIDYSNCKIIYQCYETFNGRCKIDIYGIGK